MSSDEEKTSVQTFTDLVAKARQENAYVLVLSARSPALVGRMNKLEGAELVMGRSTDAHLQLEDDGISRKHAKIARLPGGRFQLVDLGSTNGTFVNGERVEGSQELHDGDKVQLGPDTVLKFTFQDQLEEQYQRNIYESATRDALTRVFNKKYFWDSLRKEFAHCVRHRVPLSMVMVDIDHFKKVNDTYGHPAGDHVLSRVAQRLLETVRTEDLLARYGGEEFALLLRQTNAEQARICAERCRAAVNGADFLFANIPLRVTISLGVATLFDSDFARPEDLVAAADACLYRAKRAGRNRVELMRPPSSPPV